MFDNAKMKAQMGNIQVSVANPNRDGTGTVVQLFTGQASFGSIVNSIVVKAENVTGPGMVRIFIEQGGNYFLYEEFSIPASDPSSGILESYSSMFIIPSGLWLAQDVSLYASTETSEVFNVIANGYTWDYCPC